MAGAFILWELASVNLRLDFPLESQFSLLVTNTPLILYTLGNHLLFSKLNGLSHDSSWDRKNSSVLSCVSLRLSSHLLTILSFTSPHVYYKENGLLCVAAMSQIVPSCPITKSFLQVWTTRSTYKPYRNPLAPSQSLGIFADLSLLRDLIERIMLPFGTGPA